MIIKPDFLQNGDLVAIVSPAGPIHMSYISKAQKILESWGLRVVLGKHISNTWQAFAGTDEERTADFQEALTNQEVRAVFCARGGYGSVRVLPNLDFSPFFQFPKWIVGFSDITVFHSFLHTCSIASVHAAMPINFERIMPVSLQSLRNVLFGQDDSIQFNASKYNRNGSVRAPLVGGNLSVLFSLRGLSYEPNYEGKILCIEDLNEYDYHIDRILQNFKLSGILSQISGLVVGRFSGIMKGNNPFSKSVEDIIFDAVSEYTFPVCFDAPFGHEEENRALIFGDEYELLCEEEKVTLRNI
ncbi:MAG: LD-carboxypeptidase [Bacteroidales bacterium]|jgi:muramoyltetrapeptide carboxypeptidase|nr:LD-carboxypeptidase [Bacteroidales bacterium]